MMARALPSILAPHLRVVFCGDQPGAEGRKHYYAKYNNSFWQLLYDCGLTARRLRPEEDKQLLDFGIGLTDVNHDPAALRRRIKRYAPAWVAFNGRRPAAQALHYLEREITFGAYEGLLMDTSRVYVLPASSWRNDRMRERWYHWRMLADLLKEAD
jgi:double-stranded uracil-DNA glycosylase